MTSLFSFEPFTQDEIWFLAKCLADLGDMPDLEPEDVREIALDRFFNSFSPFNRKIAHYILMNI
jgi:hypothetical protein